MDNSLFSGQKSYPLLYINVELQNEIVCMLKRSEKSVF